MKKNQDLPKILKGLIFLLFNSIVSYSAKIGKYTRFAYGGIGCVIHSHAIVGEKCIIGQSVTIGRSLDPLGVPEIGNNVYISAGVRILGNIKIGDNVIIGANSTVTKDVPSNCIVAGSPAKIIKYVDSDIYDLLKDIKF
jgi:serine O-acetyltransferase